MRKRKIVLVYAFLFAGCSNSPSIVPIHPKSLNPDPIIFMTQAGYIQADRNKECFYDEAGIPVHKHPLDLDNYILDYAWVNETDEYKLCETLKDFPQEAIHYHEHQGEIKKYTERNGKYDPDMVHKVKQACKAEYEALSLKLE